jgi:hypothetical protein
MLPMSRSQPEPEFNLDRPWTATWVRRDHASPTLAALGETVASPLEVFTVEAGAIGTGCLIGTQVILTAAHCVIDSAVALLSAPPAGGDRLVQAPRTITVNIGEHGMAVATCFVHDEFLRTGAGDLALCRLNKVVALTPGLVSLKPSLVATGSSLSLFGTGETDAAGARPVRELEAKVNGTSAGGLVRAKLTQAGDDLDSGDSGGPAVAVDGGVRVVVGAIARESATNDALIAQLNSPVGKKLLALWKSGGFPAVSFAP